MRRPRWLYSKTLSGHHSTTALLTSAYLGTCQPAPTSLSFFTLNQTLLSASRRIDFLLHASPKQQVGEARCQRYCCTPPSPRPKGKIAVPITDLSRCSILCLVCPFSTRARAWRSCSPLWALDAQGTSFSDTSIACVSRATRSQQSCGRRAKAP